MNASLSGNLMPVENLILGAALSKKNSRNQKWSNRVRNRQNSLDVYRLFPINPNSVRAPFKFRNNLD